MLMSDHEDRSPLLMKLSLRQALHRLQHEVEDFSHFEALAGNLGWEELAQSLSQARTALSEAEARVAEAVEEAGRLQAEAGHEHTHPHAHPGGHSHDHKGTL
jgi:hypothetical protein